MDFLITPLGWKNWLLLISALMHFVLLFFLIIKNIKSKKNPVSFLGCLLIFFTFLWTLSLFLFSSLVDYNLIKFFASFIYSSGLPVAIILFYFAVYFPYKFFNIPKFFVYFINFLLVFTFFFFIFGYKYYVLDIQIDQNLHTHIFNNLIYLAFILLTSIFFILAITIFIRRIKLDWHLLVFRTIFLCILIAILGGFYFDIFLVYFKNFQYYHFGPILSLPMNIVIFYLIFSKRERKSVY